MYDVSYMLCAMCYVLRAASACCVCVLRLRAASACCVLRSVVNQQIQHFTCITISGLMYCDLYMLIVIHYCYVL